MEKFRSEILAEIHRKNFVLVVLAMLFFVANHAFGWGFSQTTQWTIVSALASWILGSSYLAGKHVEAEGTHATARATASGQKDLLTMLHGAAREIVAAVAPAVKAGQDTPPEPAVSGPPEVPKG